MIYLASPYGHKDPAVVADRVEKAALWTAEAWKRGYTVFSPVVHSARLVEVDPALREAAFDHDFWMPHDLNLVTAARELWVLTLNGWVTSKGVKMELDYWRVILGREDVRHFSFTDRPMDKKNPLYRNWDKPKCPENTIPWMGGCLDAADIQHMGNADWSNR